MKVIVDTDRCEGNGLCEQFAPEVFRVDDNDMVHVDHEQVEPNKGSVQLAVRSCPRGALKIVE